MDWRTGIYLSTRKDCVLACFPICFFLGSGGSSEAATGNLCMRCVGVRLTAPGEGNLEVL